VSELEPFVVDRELSRAAKRWVGFRRRLRAGEGFVEDPFEASRKVLGKTTFQTLVELEGDPVAPSVARWVYRLAEQRINRNWLVAIARARSEKPSDARYEASHQAIVKSALAHPARRRAWLKEAIVRAEPIHALVGGLWERRRAIAEQLEPKGDALDAGYLSQPCEDLHELAERWLDATQALLEAQGSTPSLDGLVTRTLAEVDPGWPSHLNPQSLLDLFRDTRLFDDLDLDPGPLPAALAPSSFMRALARVGAAFTVACAPRDQPFCIAHDAYGLERLRHGAVFGLLPLSGAFLTRRLGATRELARRATRAAATTVLFETRIAALRVLLGRAALRGRSDLAEAYADGVHRCLGIELPATAAGAFLKLRLDDPQRFAGDLWAFEMVNRLRDAHDEDWFRNPRAVDQLRSEAALPPKVTVERGALESAMSSATATLLELSS